MPGDRRKSLGLMHRIREPRESAGAGERRPMLVLLHGVGSNELAMASLANSFDPRFLVISARAPITLEPFAFAWFHVAFTDRGPVISDQELRAAWQTIARFINEAVAAYDADPARVFIVGFSQGGILALATLLTAPELVAGVVCMSGRLPPEVLPHVASDARLERKPVLIVHGSRDETLGVEYGRAARATLQALPLALEYQEFDIGHTSTPESMAVVSSWLTRLLAR
jgi:phospholipase/carboxylesterase